MTEEDHKSNDKSPPQVLELAATFRLDDVGYGRDDHGRLKDWQKWAESHPHKNEHVQVCHGREEWEIQNDEMSPNKNSVSVVSWNTLSDTWYETGDYQHTPREVGIWEGRFPIFMEWIKRLRPHVLALQEVDFQIFDSHYLPALQSMGYQGMMQRQKKDNQNPAIHGIPRHDAKSEKTKPTLWSGHLLEIGPLPSLGSSIFFQIHGSPSTTRGGC